MKIAKRGLKLGTGSDELSASDLPSNYSESNYTSTSSDTKGHLEGIDNALSGVSVPTGDISHTSFSLANNQSSAANVTGLAFANGTSRSAKVHYSIIVDATGDLFEVGTLMLIQRTSDWVISQDYTGDDSNVTFSVTAAGQVQYITPDYSGFSSATIKFRAQSTDV